MLSPSHGPEGARAENLVTRVAARLGSHVLWDSLLIFMPAVLAALFIAVSLYRAAWISPLVFWLTATCLAAGGLLSVILRYRPLIPCDGRRHIWEGEVRLHRCSGASKTR